MTPAGAHRAHARHPRVITAPGLSLLRTITATIWTELESICPGKTEVSDSSSSLGKEAGGGGERRPAVESEILGISGMAACTSSIGQEM